MNTKRNWQPPPNDFFIYGGRNLQGRTGKGPKPLGVKSEKGRNLWQPHEVVPAVGQITRAVINTLNDVKYLLLWTFWIYNVYRRILGRVLVGNIVNIGNECLIFLGSWGMNRSAEQTNRTTVHAICLSLATIHSP